MDLTSYWQKQPEFYREGKIFYETSAVRPNDFESEYIQLRQKEGRVYDDETLLRLPSVSVAHPHRREWAIRKRSSDRLIRYLRTRKINSLLEIGCGNGWLLHHISQSLPLTCCGIDINEHELRQAARVFGSSDRIALVYANILSSSFREPLAEIILLAGAIQYFPNLSLLLGKLESLLLPSGEIHILESPFHTTFDVDSAKRRSDDYFKHNGNPGMTERYFHHTWDGLKDRDYQVVYDPGSIMNRLSRFVTVDSPFPWIRIATQ